MEQAIDRLVGDVAAEDCGRLSAWASDGERAASQACVDQAIVAGTPFAVSWELFGVDSEVAEGLVSLGSGEAAYSVGYDSDPCGGGCPEEGGAYARTLLDLKVSATCEGVEICYSAIRGNVVDFD